MENDEEEHLEAREEPQAEAEEEAEERIVSNTILVRSCFAPAPAFSSMNLLL